MPSREISMVIACVLLLAAGCAKRRSLDSGQASDFPLRPGTEWTYVVTDSSAGWTDTIQVRIVLQDIGPTDTGTYWNATIHNDHNWTPPEAYVKLGDSRVVQRGDSLQFYDERPGSPPYLVILLPLEVGNGWGIAGTSTSDTATVIGVESVMTPAGTAANAFRVERIVYWEDCGLQVTSWMTPETGVVKVRSAVVGSVCFGGITTWELTAYHSP